MQGLSVIACISYFPSAPAAGSCIGEASVPWEGREDHPANAWLHACGFPARRLMGWKQWEGGKEARSWVGVRSRDSARVTSCSKVASKLIVGKF